MGDPVWRGHSTHVIYRLENAIRRLELVWMEMNFRKSHSMTGRTGNFSLSRWDVPMCRKPKCNSTFPNISIRMETRFLVHSASNIVQKLFDFSGAAQVARDFALKLYLSKRKKGVARYGWRCKTVTQSGWSYSFRGIALRSSLNMSQSCVIFCASSNVIKSQEQSRLYNTVWQLVSIFISALKQLFGRYITWQLVKKKGKQGFSHFDNAEKLMDNPRSHKKEKNSFSIIVFRDLKKFYIWRYWTERICPPIYKFNRPPCDLHIICPSLKRKK